MDVLSLLTSSDQPDPRTMARSALLILNAFSTAEAAFDPGNDVFMALGYQCPAARVKGSSGLRFCAVMAILRWSRFKMFV